ncbi:hypothetical protein TNCV_58761 [Trichonephila clavipes]|nr:hypothetical protein TNCV_58761 [Trichonephila clavipes]
MGRIDRIKGSLKNTGKPLVRKVRGVDHGSGPRCAGRDHCKGLSRRAPEQRQGVKRSIPSWISSRNYKFKRPNTSSPGVESIAVPSRLPDRRWKEATTFGSRTEGSGRDIHTRQTRATMRGCKAERSTRSNQAITRRPCPYYLRSRVKESGGTPEEQRNIEINGIPHSKIRRISLSMEALDGNPEQLSGGSVVVVHEKSTPADDRYIVLPARRNRRQTAGEIARHTTQVPGRPISRFTVARILHGGGLFARRPVRCVSLTPAHRRRRSL